MPLAKNIMRYFSIKQLVIIAISILMLIGLGTAMILGTNKNVVINTESKQLFVTTTKSTVSEVLEQNKIDVRPCDYVSQPLNSQLTTSETNQITVKYAVPVKVIYGNKKIDLMTYKDTVFEALKNSGIGITDDDRIKYVKPNTKISSNMKINVVKVRKKTVTKTVPVAYTVVSRSNSNLREGIVKTIRNGKNGVSKKTYRYVYENGKLISKRVIKTRQIRKPVSKVIERGTSGTYRTSRGSDFRYKEVLYMKAYAYTSNGYATTASGHVARVGYIAVDPRVIPLGSRVYIQGLNGAPTYGYAIASDTGGNIKGNIIDLYMNSTQECINWGARQVKVYILK